MKPRILIVGTVPFNRKSTSRAFETYFYNWEKEKLAQIFSNTKIPVKGHCRTLFQITDQDLVKRIFNKSHKVGKIYDFNELPCNSIDNDSGVKGRFFTQLYEFGSNKTPLIYLLRKYLWNKRYWCTAELNDWLDSFKPQCVFLSFSDDFFILEIAIYVAEKYKIPIVSAIGDDYFFRLNLSIFPLSNIYTLMYRSLVKRVFKYRGGAIYISEKIKSKYNEYFNINGETVYLTSSINRKEFQAIDSINPKITYCGNLRLGRNLSLNEVGVVLGRINQNYILNVYSNETDPKYYKLFETNPNIKFHGSVSYNEVQEIMIKSDVVVIVEGFRRKDIEATKYSLSTKVADSLASGSCVVCYGPKDSGVVEYLGNTCSCIVCSEITSLENELSEIFTNIDLQREYYHLGNDVSRLNHNIDRSTELFENTVSSLVDFGHDYEE